MTAAKAIKQWQRSSRAQRTSISAVAGILVAFLVLFLVYQSSGPAPRVRQYLTFKACLLTDAQGITGKQAAPVWAAMEEASLKTHARVQYLPVFGPSTVPNALPYLASLVQRHCDIVVVTGDAASGAVAADADKFRTTRFVVIGASAARMNVTSIAPSPATLHAAVADVIIHAVDASA
ncbi:MAG TPA: hypothetical protein VNW94_18800 [Streptosporangiaceae bacterium]|nr:hypothetical protein [Streptosporangiaceae bacterium]